MILTSISDHLPVFAFLGGPEACADVGPQYALRRLIGCQGKAKFRDWIKQWGENFAPCTDLVADDAVNFRIELRDAYNTFFHRKR